MIKMLYFFRQEPEENVVWNVGTSYENSRFHYSVLKFDETGVGRAREIGKIPSRRRDQPCYMHSFGISKDFIVILEQPLFVDKTATNGINLHHHLKWKSHLPVNIFKTQFGEKLCKIQFSFLADNFVD